MPGLVRVPNNTIVQDARHRARRVLRGGHRAKLDRSTVEAPTSKASLCKTLTTVRFVKWAQGREIIGPDSRARFTSRLRVSATSLR